MFAKSDMLDVLADASKIHGIEDAAVDAALVIVFEPILHTPPLASMLMFVPTASTPSLCPDLP